jgi:uncharacterized membrane protein YqiK
MRTLDRIVPASLAALVLLAGCTVPSIPTTGAGSATTSRPTDPAVAEACDALGAAMSKTGATLNTALQQVTTDPQKALATVQPLADDFSKAVAKIDNPTVRAQGDKAAAALNGLVAALGEAIKDSTRLPALTGAFGKVQQEFTALVTLCQGR